MEHNQHQHVHKPSEINRAFMIGIFVNVLYVIIEFSAGLYYNSLALLSDAGHNLGDVFSLFLALIAFRLSKMNSSIEFTYGYKKTTVLVSLLNSIILLIVIIGIILESLQRLKNPVVLPGTAISLVAAMGIVINAFSAMLFFKDKENDLNVKGAYLHLMADAAISLGVVVSGVIISLWSIYWLDIIISMVIAIIILFSTWKLLIDSGTLILDGVPHNVDIKKIIDTISNIDEIHEIHHLHVWALSTSENALTMHIVLKNKTDLANAEFIKNNVKHELEHFNIHHVTLELERIDKNCDDKNKCMVF